MVAPVTVQSIDPGVVPTGFHVLHLDCGAALRCRTVLLAAGVHLRRLEADGAARFEAAGVHYACTTVEAMLYDKQDVAVVGGGNSAGQAAMYLAECCPERLVHLLVRRRLGPDMSAYLVGRLREAANVRIHEAVEIAAVQGQKRLESVTLRAFDATGPGAGAGAGAGAGDSQQSTPLLATLPVAAVFVFIGADPGCSWLPETVARDKLGYILTGTDALHCGRWPLADREPCPLETTVPGILAAGDIRAGSVKRVGFAVGDGSLAVTCVHRLIAIRQ
jgi:thioredoxin reductase (NADPH)